MMQLTRKWSVLAPLLLSASTATFAQVDESCLKHLGGTSYDVACFDALRKEVAEDSQSTYEEIRKTIPQGNGNRDLLDAYMKAEDDAERFCRLEKETGTGWLPSPTPGHENMWDAAYAECIYDQRKQQNKRLHEILNEHIGQ
jgi:hypothetical protein